MFELLVQPRFSPRRQEMRLRQRSTRCWSSAVLRNRKGAAADCGLKVGDVVLTINGSDVTSDSQATMLLKEAESVITIRVTRLIVRKSA